MGTPSAVCTRCTLYMGAGVCISVIAAVGGVRGNGPEDSYIKTEYIPVNADNVSEYLE